MEQEDKESIVHEKILCVPAFLEGVRENVHFIMGCKQMLIHHEELMIFAQMLVIKYGRDVCLTCPSFHVICGSTPSVNFRGSIEDFGGADSIKAFLDAMKNQCEPN